MGYYKSSEMMFWVEMDVTKIVNTLCAMRKCNLWYGNKRASAIERDDLGRIKLSHIWATLTWMIIQSNIAFLVIMGLKHYKETSRCTLLSKRQIERCRSTDILHKSWCQPEKQQMTNLYKAFFPYVTFI